MTAITGDDISAPSPWKSLAQQARRLAEIADQYAQAAPADLAPRTDDDDEFNAFTDLNARATALVGVVAACRRATWKTLHDQGENYSAIARMWNSSPQNVSQTLKAPKQPH
jgi:predicted RNA-binding Zn ribbon-like protein